MSDEATPTTEVPDLRLRGDPPRVMRLSRKALAILGLVGGTAIGGALLYALQPIHKPAPQELYEAQSHATPDSLAGAPKDYTQVPKLGPPLPGDLGRPIVAAQARGVDANPPVIGTPAPVRPAGSVSPAAAARQRAGQERDSARTSKLFLDSAAGVPAGGAAQKAASFPGLALAPLAASPPTAAATGGDDDQSRKRAFLTADPQHHTVSAERPTPLPSPYTLLAGSVVQAAMITGVRSDLPGQVTAQVTANVYDSATGHLLLIPQGSKLIGEYDSQISFGQNRVLLTWNRLILPDGRSLVLAREPGADAGGFAGLQDEVNYHWGGIGKAALLSTLLGVGAEVASSGDDALLRAVRQGSSDTINQAGQQIVRRQLTVPPTLSIRPGYPVRVIVTHDLVLAPPQGE
jgi:type IV secretory pathway VirB10-like protein